MPSKKTIVELMIRIMIKHDFIKKDDSQALSDGFEKSSVDSFVDFLLEEGIVQQDDILLVLEEAYGITSFDVQGYFFDHDLLHQFPKSVMLRNAFIPLEHDDNVLIVIAADPSDENLLEVIGESVSYDVVFLVGIRGDICDAVKEFYDKSLTEVDPDQDARNIPDDLNPDVLRIEPDFQQEQVIKIEDED